ncbi:MAG: folate-binding protein YgfZ [bacterium]|nr:folate-binding protein YgfZ [bacterium]
MSDGGVTEDAAGIRFQTDIAALTQRVAAVPGRFGVIWIRGADAVSFLDGLISQSVAATEPGAVRRSLLLTPQGKMRAFLWVLGSADGEVGLITQSTTEDIAIADLTRFKFRVDATIELDSRPTTTLVGPGAEDVLLAADVPRPGQGWLATQAGLVARVPFTSGEIPRFVLVGDAVAAVAAVAPVAGDMAYESARISMGEPLGAVDFDDGTISHELGPVEAAVDFTKGCYLGQELVARIDSRGRVIQSLRGISATGSVSMVGARLTTPERDVGVVTSSAPAPGGSGTIGLALVRHEVDNGSQVTATFDDEQLAATVEALPFPIGG